MDARCNVDAVALQHPVVNDDVFHVDADAQTQSRTGPISVCRLLTARCTSMAQRSAFTALGNSTRSASPAISTMRPPCWVVYGSMISVRSAFHCRSVSPSLAASSREKPATSAKAIAARRLLRCEASSTGLS